jgi:S-adenosylmethionine synthetase
MGWTRPLSKQGEMDDNSIETNGAGDQGLMFGFACDETRAYAHAHFPCPQNGQKHTQVRKTAPFLTSPPTEKPRSRWI